MMEPISSHDDSLPLDAFGLIKRMCDDFPTCSHDAVHGCGMEKQPGRGTTGGHYINECPRPRCLPRGTR